VNALAAEFAQTRPAISAHLRILREARIVSEQRAGRQRLYRLEPSQLREVDAWIATYRPMWESKLASLKRYLEAEK
jgi:DNA-binding transcriptional ArsR family regulator